MFRVACYRFRTTFRHRWGGLLSIVLLIGLVGGLAMGAIAGARRTQSSFPKFLRSTNPSDLVVVHNDSVDDSNATDPKFLRTLAHLPHVQHVASASGISELVLGPDGAPAQDARHRLFNSSAQILSDSSGEFYDQDRPTAIEGRLANPRRSDEMVMSADAADLLHLRVGDVLHFGIYTNAQTLENGYGTAALKPRLRIGVRLVGIVKFHFEIVRDDFDHGLRFVLLSPALTRPLQHCCAATPIAGLRLDRGSHDDAVVEAAIKQQTSSSSVIQIAAVEEATAERAIAPESVALGAFGAIAALAAILIAGQAIGRRLRDGSEELDTMRALGAGPVMTMADGLLGVIGAVVVGALLAATVAAALSPLSPLGPARAYVSRGTAVDWTVLGTGIAASVFLLSAIAIVFAYWHAPHRVARRSALIIPRQSRVAAAAAAAGVAVSGVAGIRFAFDRGRDKRAVPLRSAILGAALAVTIVIATVVFGTSLSALVSHPALYGWNWDYEMLGNYGGLADIPLPQTARLLDRDPYVATWSRASFDELRIDNLAVPILGATPKAAVAPPVLSGHALDAPDQVVLGPTTLAQLHKRVGDSVVFNNGVTKSTRLVIVGTATLPAIGAGQTLHLEIGTGAVLSEQLIPVADRGFGDLPNSPEAVFVRLRPGANASAARRSLERIATAVERIKGHGPPSIVSVQRPAEIVNYRTMRSTPALLGAALAASAVIALGLTLLSSVRSRRRDLALLKTLGFRRRQLAATVAWQASIAVAIGVGIGVPLGIITGRELWKRFATALHVVPTPSVPSFTIALIAVGALVLANVVAAFPGLQAARTQTAVLLRAE